MHPAPLVVMDYVGPAVAALVFVGIMSLVAEPRRRTLKVSCVWYRSMATSLLRGYQVSRGFHRNGFS